jgi:hypothetical protein
MKHAKRLAVIVLSVSALAASGVGAAESPASPPAAGGAPESSEFPCHPHRGELAEERLKTLHKDLKLKADQEAAWKEWADKMQAGRAAWKERHKEFESMSSLPAPERMEKMLAFSKERLSKQEERLAATKSFYATLSAEQKQIFDKEFTFKPRGPHGRHGRK